MVDKKQESNVLSLLKSFVVFVWLVEGWFGVILGVLEFEILDFASRPISSTPLSWEFLAISRSWHVLICLVSSTGGELMDTFILKGINVATLL